jgi:hypothetical protein
MKDKIFIQKYQIHDFIFAHESAECKYLGHSSWDTNLNDPNTFQPFGDVSHLTYGEDHTNAVLKADGGIISISLRKRAIDVSVAANTKKVIETLVARVKKIFPEAEVAEDGMVDVKFHFQTNNGPTHLGRRIEVPEWEEITENYESSTRKELNKLFSDFTPAHGGQLILFQGEPGTGKSFVLRALCSAWKEWCSVEYIVDPDAFFGAGSYLMSLLAQSGDDIEDFDDPEDIAIIESENKKKKDWKLFILEDTGELLSEDAKDRTGQGLARLLNVVDGFIGQGLRILILITSNEDLGKLHPAVSRPGRCAAVVKFKELNEIEAEAWAKKKGFTLPVRKSYSLAELFSLSNDYQNKADTKVVSPLGFRMVGS